MVRQKTPLFRYHNINNFNRDYFGFQNFKLEDLDLPTSVIFLQENIVRAIQSIVFSAKPFSISYDNKILTFIQRSRTQPNIGFESHFNIIFVSQSSFIT